MTDLQQEQNGSKGAFYIEKENKRVAEITYTLPVPGKMIIDHTEVSDELRGQNAGYQLVQTAVEYARAHKLIIIPLCPFAIPIAIGTVIKKNPEFHDVLSTH
jgi:predicted GNAT family acetyltransferase